MTYVLGSRNHIRIWICSVLSAVLLLPSFVRAESVEGSGNRRLSDVVSISASDWAVFAIKSDGSAWAWGGFRDIGLLGNGSTVPVTSPVRMLIDDVKSITGGSSHTLILKHDGTVWATGKNEYGQLGIGEISTSGVTKPIQVKGLEDVTSISAHANQSMALKSDGTVWQWGYADRVNPPTAEPKKVEGLSLVKTIAAAAMSGVAIDNGGQVWAWGTSLMETNPDRLRKPTVISGINESMIIEAAGSRAAAIQFDGKVKMWANYKSYPDAGKLLFPLEIEHGDHAMKLEGGANSIFSFIKEDGTVWMWDAYLSDYWSGSKYTAVQVKGIDRAIDLANGWNRQQYALLSNGTVMEWTYGYNRIITQPKLVEKAIDVKVEGELLDLPVPPLMINNVTYVPLRGVFENLGATVKWSPGSPNIEVIKGDTVLEMWIPKKQSFEMIAKANQTDPQPITVNFTTMVPLRFVAEVLGAKVKWSQEHHSIEIEMP